MAWFGPKGVATMAFSLLVLAEGFPGAERIFNLAALCVFTSILAHGLTDTPASNWVASRERCACSCAARERERGLAPALLAEDEAHLRRRLQAVRVIGPERRAGLVEFERAEAVAGEEAVLARHLLRPLRARRRNHCRHVLRQPLRSRLRHNDRPRSKRSGAGRARPAGARIRKTQGFRVLPANSPLSCEFLPVCEMPTPQSAGFSRRVSLGSMSRLQPPLQTLVTGVSGYVGAALVPRLVRDGHAVRGFARSRERVLAAGRAARRPRARRRHDRRGAGPRRSTASTSPTT